MVLGAVQMWCEFSPPVSQQGRSDLCFEALDVALKQSYKKKHIFQLQKTLKSAQTTVDDLMARESDQVGEQKLYTICAAIEDLKHGTAMESNTELMQFQVGLIRIHLGAT